MWKSRAPDQSDVDRYAG